MTSVINWPSNVIVFRLKNYLHNHETEQGSYQQGSHLFFQLIFFNHNYKFIIPDHFYQHFDLSIPFICIQKGSVNRKKWLLLKVVTEGHPTISLVMGKKRKHTSYDILRKIKPSRKKNWPWSSSSFDIWLNFIISLNFLINLT